MSKVAIEKFLTESKDNRQIQEKLIALKNYSKDLNGVETIDFVNTKLLPFIKECGYDVNLDDFLNYPYQISDEELENVSGGLWSQAIAIPFALISLLNGFSLGSNPSSSKKDIDYSFKPNSSMSINPSQKSQNNIWDKFDLSNPETIKNLGDLVKKCTSKFFDNTINKNSDISSYNTNQGNSEIHVYSEDSSSNVTNDLKGELEKLKAENEKLRSENNELRIKNENSENEIGNLRKELNNKNSSSAKEAADELLQAENENLKKEIEKLKNMSSENTQNKSDKLLPPPPTGGSQTLLPPPPGSSDSASNTDVKNLLPPPPGGWKNDNSQNTNLLPPPPTGGSQTLLPPPPGSSDSASNTDVKNLLPPPPGGWKNDNSQNTNLLPPPPTGGSQTLLPPPPGAGNIQSTPAQPKMTRLTMEQQNSLQQKLEEFIRNQKAKQNEQARQNKIDSMKKEIRESVVNKIIPLFQFAVNNENLPGNADNMVEAIKLRQAQRNLTLDKVNEQFKLLQDKLKDFDGSITDVTQLNTDSSNTQAYKALNNYLSNPQQYNLENLCKQFNDAISKKLDSGNSSVKSKEGSSMSINISNPIAKADSFKLSKQKIFDKANEQINKLNERLSTNQNKIKEFTESAPEGQDINDENYLKQIFEQYQTALKEKENIENDLKKWNSEQQLNKKSLSEATSLLEKVTNLSEKLKDAEGINSASAANVIDKAKSALNEISQIQSTVNTKLRYEREYDDFINIQKDYESLQNIKDSNGLTESQEKEYQSLQNLLNGDGGRYNGHNYSATGTKINLKDLENNTTKYENQLNSYFDNFDNIIKNLDSIVSNA